MQKRLPMKRVLMLFLLLLYTCSFSFAQSSPKSSLLWEISGKGLQQPSYIFGTFHMMCKEDFIISDIMLSKLTGTAQFFGEVDLDDPAMQAKLVAKLMMTDKTWQSLLSADDYQKMSSKFQSVTGMPMAMFNKFKPFMGLSLLMINTFDCAEKVQPETEMVKIAKENHLPIRGLETVEEQMDVIDKEPIDSQMKELKQSVLNFDSIKIGLSQMLTVYKTRNIDSLNAFIKKTGINEDFSVELLDHRNKKWIPLIEKAITEKATFFAVGAGHLGGSEGVLSLLRKQGYRVIPVTY
jgi:uncharacterized protein YbaP (TraB family)